VKVGPEYDASTVDGFWPPESRLVELQQETLDMQLQALLLSGLHVEVVHARSEGTTLQLEVCVCVCVCVCTCVRV
jgi:hypothetical protein